LAWAGRGLMSSATGEQIELSFQLELADVLSARWVLLWKSRSGKVALALVAILLANAFASSLAWGVSASVGVVVYFALMFYVLPRRTFRTTPAMRGTQTWTIGPDVLRCESTTPDGARLSSSEFGWALMLRARESKRAFLLSPSRTGACVLPKRALDPARADALRALIAAKVGKGS
jgi:YcxB-like protein